MQVGAWDYLADKLLRLLPNAISLGISSTSLENSRVESGQLQQTGQHDNNILPPILSSVALTSIDHPDSMALWDLRFDLFSALEFADFDTTYTLLRPGNASASPPIPDQELSYTLKLFMAVPTINGEISVHTPIGTTFAALGWGPGLYTYQDSLGNGATGGVSVIRLEVGHTVFVSARWFLEMTVNVLSPSTAPVHNDLFTFDSRTYGILGVGYYFPESHSLLRREF